MWKIPQLCRNIEQNIFSNLNLSTFAILKNNYDNRSVKKILFDQEGRK